MAFRRTHAYPVLLQQQAFYFKALSHPERISIIQFLQKHGPQNVGAIVKHSPLRLKAVSQHLKILRQANILLFEERYPYTFYYPNQPVLDRIDVLCRKLGDDTLKTEQAISSFSSQ